MTVSLLATVPRGSDEARAQNLTPSSAARARRSSAVISVVQKLNGIVYEEPVSLLLISSVERNTGKFEGRYEVASAPGSRPFELLDWIAIPPWDTKLAMKIDGQPLTIAELGRLHVDVAYNTAGNSGSFWASNLTIRGHAENLNMLGTFVTKASATAGSELAGSFTIFDPAGPGRILFTTRHTFASGEVKTSTGVISLTGNPRAELRDRVCAHFAVRATETDSDNSDGMLAGTFSGNATLSASLCR